MKNHFFLLLLFCLFFTGCHDSDNLLNDVPMADDSVPLPSANNMIVTPGAAGIAGVNWADARDNFVDGWVIPSGLTASDDYATVQAKADDILSGFQNNMGANTVRLPINPNSVLEAWWGAYTGAIDMAISKNMKVIIACWEAESSKDGRVDDLSSFWNMWQQVINKYKNIPNVYFEVFNEPHGYSVTELTDLYAEWLNRYADIPRDRILLGGKGYSEDVTPIGADNRFDGCLLSLHIYAWWGSYTNPAQWQTTMRSRYGSYASRTILTEFGVPMTTGVDYNGSINDNAEIAFLQGISTELRQHQISSVYWPGLRNGDSFSIQQLNGSGTNLSLSTTNNSGLYRIQFGWGVGTSLFDPNAYYTLTNRNSGQVLDVNQSSTDGGANVIQWPGNNGSNQQWQIRDIGGGYYKIVNRNSGHALDVDGGSSENGASVIQWYENGGFNQQWEISEVSDGYYKIVNRNSGQVLDVDGASTSNEANIIQWPWNGGNNQQWQIVQQ